MSEETRRPSIATIFNPRRSKGSGTQRPSVVVTDEDSNNPSIFTNGCEGMRDASPRNSLVGGPSLCISPIANRTDIATGASNENKKKKRRCNNLRNCICSIVTRKILCGFFVTAGVTVAWTGTTHLLKDIYLRKQIINNHTDSSSDTKNKQVDVLIYSAPLFTTWFCTVSIGLFFPIYLLGYSCLRHNDSPVQTSVKNITQRFREMNITFGKFLTRCMFFAILWSASNYMYFYALQLLDCTDILALYATHIGFAYILSWVILHEQFVGVRIVAVILCNTGIALLAYMDGVYKRNTLLGVVLTAASAAAIAIYKVLFKKVLFYANYGQKSLFISCIALLSTLLLSPIIVVLMLTEKETILWNQLPWLYLLATGALFFVKNFLVSYGPIITYETFITLGIIGAVPLSAAIEQHWYKEKFEGMKLAGIVLIICGFMLVLFPANWPQFLSKLLRWGRYRNRRHHGQHQEPIDYRTGLISRSHLRSPSGLIR